MATIKEFKEIHKEGLTLNDFMEAAQLGLVDDKEFMETFKNGRYKTEKGVWKPCISFIDTEFRNKNDVAHAYIGKGTITWLDSEHYEAL